MPIGVFDSGLGGLTVLRALVDAAPSQPFVYFGDAENAPYGAKSQQEVRDLTVAGVDRLFAEGCRLVIVACNTAASIGLRRLQQDWLPGRQDGAEPPMRALGVFAPIVEAMTGRDWADQDGAPRVVEGVRAVFFATPATVASGAFEREVALRAPGVEVVAVGCDGLADAIERGDTPLAADLARRAVAEALERSHGLAPQIAVLGCTHYPMAENAFRAALPPNVTLLNQPAVAAASLARYLQRRPEYEERVGPARGPRLRCLTSGDPARFGPLASAFFGAPLAFERS